MGNVGRWRGLAMPLPGVVAFVVIAALLALVVGASAARGAGPTAAWCHDGGGWLGYAEGIPGSAARDRLTACLRANAGQGEIVAIQGQLVPGGALLDLGDASLYWDIPSVFGVTVTITAYDHRIVLQDSCERTFEMRNGAVSMIGLGFPCVGKERIREDPRTVMDADFTIYVVGRQFVVDGAGGWYHIVRDRTGWDEDTTPRGQIVLRPVPGGAWVSTKRSDPGLTGGSIYDINEPLAGTGNDWQQYRAYDWETRLWDELFPPSFNTTAQYLLPDWDAYWAEVRRWLDAIMDDLFHGRAAPVELVVLDVLGWEAYASGRAIFISFASTNVILHELAHIVAGENEGHGGRFVATLLMFWERYVPGFDTARAVELARRYSVEVGRPVEVEPVSDRTRAVRELLAKTAPILPSDDITISPNELLHRIVLEVGRTYGLSPETIVATSSTVPICEVTERYSDGTTYQNTYLPQATFTINPGGEWNGLSLSSYGGGGESGVSVSGTPTAAGRVRVEVSTKCPGGEAQADRLVGYSEVVVVAPDSQR